VFVGDSYTVAAALALALEHGALGLSEVTMEEWQWALAYWDGQSEAQRERMGIDKKSGKSDYSPEEMMARTAPYTESNSGRRNPRKASPRR
jgi:hypothetical protein